MELLWRKKTTQYLSFISERNIKQLQIDVFLFACLLRFCLLLIIAEHRIVAYLFSFFASSSMDSSRSTSNAGRTSLCDQACHAHDPQTHPRFSSNSVQPRTDMATISAMMRENDKHISVSGILTMTDWYPITAAYSAWCTAPLELISAYSWNNISTFVSQIPKLFFMHVLKKDALIL